jgi:hypothetical protein
MTRLSDIAQHRKPVEEVVGGLLSASSHESAENGKKLIEKARDAGLSLRDYLTLAVDVKSGASGAANQAAGLNGYEAALSHLNLPFGNDFEQGVVLQAASDTFATYTGTRAMFPEVLDDMLKQAGRIEQLENTAALVSQSRVINGVEMISTVMEDTVEEDGTFTIAESGKIPVRAVRTSQNSVRMYKHGSGYEFTYEFNRRASLDIITPFASRVARRLEISKVAAATSVLISGDGVNAAATAEDLATYGADFAGTKTLKDNYRALAKFIMAKWKAGYTIDTIACNFDLYVEMMFMFAQTNIGTASDIQNLQAAGAPGINLPVMNGMVNVVLSSSIPDGYFVAFVKRESLEELVEAGSTIAESERSITNQVVTYVRSENTGYKLSFPDGRFYVKAKA